MSTAAIRRVLDSVAETDLGKRIPARLAQAYAEVEAIEKAAATIVKDDTGDEWAMPEERAEAGRLMERVARQASVEKVAPPPEPA